MINVVLKKSVENLYWIKILKDYFYIKKSKFFKRLCNKEYNDFKDFFKKIYD